MKETRKPPFGRNFLKGTSPGPSLAEAGHTERCLPTAREMNERQREAAGAEQRPVRVPPARPGQRWGTAQPLPARGTHVGKAPRPGTTPTFKSRDRTWGRRGRPQHRVSPPLHPRAARQHHAAAAGAGGGGASWRRRRSTMRLRGCCSGRGGGGVPLLRRAAAPPARPRGEGSRAGSADKRALTWPPPAAAGPAHPPGRARAPPAPGAAAARAAGENGGRREAEAAPAAAIPVPPPARPHLRSRRPHRGWSSAPSY